MKSTVAQLRVNADSVVEISVRPIKSKTTQGRNETTREGVHNPPGGPHSGHRASSPNRSRQEPIRTAIDGALAMASLPTIREATSTAASSIVNAPSPLAPSTRSSSPPTAGGPDRAPRQETKSPNNKQGANPLTASKPPASQSRLTSSPTTSMTAGSELRPIASRDKQRKPTPMPLSLPPPTATLGGLAPGLQVPPPLHGKRNGHGTQRPALAAFTDLAPVSEELPEPTSSSRPMMPSRPRSITTAATAFNSALKEASFPPHLPRSTSSETPSPVIVTREPSESSASEDSWTPDRPTSQLLNSRTPSNDFFVTPCSTPTTSSEDIVDEEVHTNPSPTRKSRGVRVDEEPRTPTSVSSSFGIIPLEERRARARSLGAPTNGNGNGAHHASLDAAALGSNPSLPTSLATSLPSLTSLTPAGGSSRHSSLRSGTPNVDIIAARKRASEEAARFASQRCSPRPPTNLLTASSMARARARARMTTRGEPERSANAGSSSLCDPLRRAVNPLCRALERVAPCKSGDSGPPGAATEEDVARPAAPGPSSARTSLDVMKTVTHAVEVEELPSRRLQREDEARRRHTISNADIGSRVVGGPIAGPSAGRMAAEQAARAIKAMEACKGPTPVVEGYESTVSAVTMARAVNSAMAASALPSVLK